MDLLDELTELRVATLLPHAAFRVETGRAAIRASLKRGLARIEAGQGELLVRRRVPSGRLVACVGFWHLERAWHCGPVQVGLVEHAIDDPGAIAFVLEAMAALTPQLGPHYELSLSTAYPQVRRGLLAQGVLGIDSLELLGEPRRALKRLVARYDPPRTLAHLGLRSARLLERERVHEVVALQLEFFGRHPEYCWFYANPGFAEQHVATLQQELPTSLHHVILDAREQLVGYFGASLESDNAMWGRKAGMDLVLVPELQGRGIAKSAYRVLLEGLVERGVRVFKGGTAQPAVLGLARLMQRPALAAMMRPGTAFGPEHFGL